MKRTQQHLDDYAKEGLRTLCVAKRVCILLFSLPLSTTLNGQHFKKKWELRFTVWCLVTIDLKILPFNCVKNWF